jgi:hypothetical protein
VLQIWMGDNYRLQALGHFQQRGECRYKNAGYTGLYE